MPQIFGAPTASDGIMMGHQGMRYSLVSREVIADCLEVVAGGMNHDGLLAIGGCDKNMPGCVMAMARLNIPSIFVYGGSILPGIGPDGGDIDIVSHLRGGRPVPGRQARREGRPQDRVRGVPRGRLLRRHVHRQHDEFAPSRRWACRCPTTPANPAVSAAKERETFLAGKALVQLIEKDIRPRDIITRKSLENAYTLVLALGGSTNAVLHLMAIAREAEVAWTLADFDRLGDKVPHLADLKPGGQLRHERPAPGRRHAGRAEGAARRRLAARRLPDRDRQDAGREPRRTCRASTSASRTWSSRWTSRCTRRGTSSSCTATWRRRGRWPRWPGLKKRRITGPAKVFDGEEACFAAIQKREIKPGDVVVIRGEGPVGGPGMREMLSVTAALVGPGARRAASA